MYSLGEAARLLAARPARLRGWIDGCARADLFLAGDSVAAIADGFDLAVADVEAAIRYESRTRARESGA